jgi:hypothetical protein
VNARLYLPVIHGSWKQHELWDGTYTFNDWLDAVEIIEVEIENKQRQADYLESQLKG